MITRYNHNHNIEKIQIEWPDEVFICLSNYSIYVLVFRLNALFYSYSVAEQNMIQELSYY